MGKYKLNLINDCSGSDYIQYKKYKFPDGQQNIVITKGVCNPKIDEVEIISRLNNWMDLELIVCTTKSLNNLGYKNINLLVPYIIGGRSDRKFEEGSTNYIKDVLAPVINSLNFVEVTTLDPHSDVTEACINNLNKLNYHPLRSLIPYLQSFNNEINDIVLISPDSGASKKVTKLAKDYKLDCDIMYCSKYRNEKGELTDNFIPWDDKYRGKILIIVDDICDGGRTFLNLADDIRKHDKTCDLVLCVSHGIFSKGLEELKTKFDLIACTNSYSDLDTQKQLIQTNIF